MFVNVPTEDSDLFAIYFECIWHMEIPGSDDWGIWYQKKLDIEKVMQHYYSEASTACFMMLCRAHDIIFDREY